MSDVTTPTPESTDSAPTPAAAPAVKLTAQERRDAATAGWADLIGATPTVTPAEVAALFAAAPNGREHLDTAYNATVTQLATVPENLANLADLLPPIAAHRDAVLAAMPATSARTSRPAPVADPAAERAALVSEFLGRERISEHLRAAAEWLDAVNAARLGDADEPTPDEVTAATVAEVPAKLAEVLERIAAPARTARTGRTGTSPAAPDTSPLGPIGAEFRHTVGDELFTCTVTAAEQLDGGKWRCSYSVHGADGRLVGTATSPTGAALLVNGGGSVNGRKFWNPPTA